MTTPEVIQQLKTVDTNQYPNALRVEQNTQMADHRKPSFHQDNVIYTYYSFNYHPKVKEDTSTMTIQSLLVRDVEEISDYDWEKIELSLSLEDSLQIATVKAKTKAGARIEIKYLEGKKTPSTYIDIRNANPTLDGHYKLAQDGENITVEPSPNDIEGVVGTFYDLMEWTQWIVNKGFTEGQ